MNDVSIITFPKQSLFGLIDAEDTPALIPFYRFKAVLTDGLWYVVARKRGASDWGQLLHRLLLNAPDGIQVDHRNHNGLDNRRFNLRLATQSQNNANQRKWKRRCHSQFKGVSKLHGEWRACVMHQKRQIHLGLFNTEEQAALAYNRKALELWGEFAWLNQVSANLKTT